MKQVNFQTPDNSSEAYQGNGAKVHSKKFFSLSRNTKSKHTPLTTDRSGSSNLPIELNSNKPRQKPANSVVHSSRGDSKEFSHTPQFNFKGPYQDKQNETIPEIKEQLLNPSLMTLAQNAKNPSSTSHHKKVPSKSYENPNEVAPVLERSTSHRTSPFKFKAPFAFERNQSDYPRSTLFEAPTTPLQETIFKKPNRFSTLDNLLENETDLNLEHVQSMFFSSTGSLDFKSQGPAFTRVSTSPNASGGVSISSSMKENDDNQDDEQSLDIPCEITDDDDSQDLIKDVVTIRLEDFPELPNVHDQDQSRQDIMNPERQGTQHNLLINNGKGTSELTECSTDVQNSTKANEIMLNKFEGVNMEDKKINVQEFENSNVIVHDQKNHAVQNRDESAHESNNVRVGNAASTLKDPSIPVKLKSAEMSPTQISKDPSTPVKVRSINVLPTRISKDTNTPVKLNSIEELSIVNSKREAKSKARTRYFGHNSKDDGMGRELQHALLSENSSVNEESPTVVSLAPSSETKKTYDQFRSPRGLKKAQGHGLIEIGLSLMKEKLGRK